MRVGLRRFAHYMGSIRQCDWILKDRTLDGKKVLTLFI